MAQLLLLTGIQWFYYYNVFLLNTILCLQYLLEERSLITNILEWKILTGKEIA